MSEDGRWRTTSDEHWRMVLGRQHRTSFGVGSSFLVYVESATSGDFEFYCDLLPFFYETHNSHDVSRNEDEALLYFSWFANEDLVPGDEARG